MNILHKTNNYKFIIDHLDHGKVRNIKENITPHIYIYIYKIKICLKVMLNFFLFHPKIYSFLLFYVNNFQVYLGNDK
jgi:hypothetical protein